MPEQLVSSLKIKDESLESKVIPQEQMQNKLSESKREMNDLKQDSANDLMDQTKDCMNEQFDNYLNVPSAQIEMLAEKKIEEEEEKEKKILSEGEKDEVLEKTIEEHVLDGEELEEIVDEEAIVCGEMKMIVQKIKIATRDGVVKSVAERMVRVEEAGAGAMQKGLEAVANSEKESADGVAEKIGEIKDSAASELSKELSAAAEECGSEGIGKEEAREKVGEIAERSMRETGLKRMAERIGLIAENKDMKALKDLLERCEEDEKLMGKAVEELSKPAVKDNEQEFREKCKELFAEKKEFLKELEQMPAEDVLKRMRGYLDELETNRYVERMRSILRARDKKAAKELKNLGEELAETQEGCDRLKSIIESNLDKEDMLDALKELANELHQGRMRWKLEDLLKEHEEKGHPKEKLLKCLRCILRQEYMKMLACRTFKVAARNMESQIMDELVNTIERNIDTHRKIAYVLREKPDNGGDGGSTRSAKGSIAYMLKGLMNLKMNGKGKAA